MSGAKFVKVTIIINDTRDPLWIKLDENATAQSFVKTVCEKAGVEKYEQYSVYYEDINVGNDIILSELCDNKDTLYVYDPEICK